MAVHGSRTGKRVRIRVPLKKRFGFGVVEEKARVRILFDGCGSDSSKMVVSLEADLGRGASLRRFGFGKAGGSGGAIVSLGFGSEPCALGLPDRGRVGRAAFPCSVCLGRIRRFWIFVPLGGYMSKIKSSDDCDEPS
jgi:hypothetical protein